MPTGDTGSKEGVRELLPNFGELYQVDKNQSAFLEYKEFEQFKRPHDMNMKDFMNTFDCLNNTLTENDTKIPDSVLEFRLLKGTLLLLSDTKKPARKTIKISN